MDTGKDAVDDIGTEVFTAKAHDFRLMADEEGDDPLGAKVDDEGRKKAEDDAYTDAVAERLPPALIVSGASILCGEGGDGREHGRGDEEEEADDLLHDADCGGDFDAAAVCDGGDDEKGDLDKPVLTGDGKTYGKERLHAEGIEGEGLLREGKAKVGAVEV